MSLKENGDVLFGNTSVFNLIPNPFNQFNVSPGKIEIYENSNTKKTAMSIFRQGSFNSVSIPGNGFNDAQRSALDINLLNTNTSGGSALTGINCETKCSIGTSYGLNLKSDVTGNNGSSYGMFLRSSSGGQESYGIDLTSSIGGTGNTNYGIKSFSLSLLGTNAKSNYGVYSLANGNISTNSFSYAFYGTASGTNSFAGYFNGRIFSTNALVVSDKTLKKDVKLEEGVIEKLNKLKPVTYNFIEDKKVTGLNLSDRLQHGFIAQELEEVFPELVEEILNPIFNEKNEQIGTKTLKAVNYVGLISVLTSSINEMSKKIDSLEERLNEKNSTLIVNNTSKFSDNELLNIERSSYSLGQNIPNPFKDKTTINYSLPENERDAKILILNLNGQLIKEYLLNEIKGQITIDSGILQKGMYLYTLISNNEEIITKKMIVN